MGEPSATSALVSVMFCANAADALSPPNATTTAAAANILYIMRSLVLGKLKAITAGEVLFPNLSRTRTRPACKERKSALARNFPAAGHATIDREDRAGGVAG